MQIKTSFRNKILLITGIILIVSLSVITMINNQMAKRSLQAKLFDQEIPSLIENILGEVDKEFMTVATALTVISEDPFLQNWLIKGEPSKDLPFIEERLIRNTKRFDTMGSNLVSWKTKNYYNYSNGAFNVTKVTENDTWFPAFKESGDTVNINPYTDHADLGEVAFMNVRIDRNGEFLGLISVSLGLSDFIEAVVNKTIGRDGQNMMISPDGTVRLHKNKELISVYNLADSTEYKAHLAAITSSEDYRFQYKNSNNEVYYVNTRFIPELGWYLITEASEKELFKDIHRSVLSSSLVAMVFFLLGLGLLFIITGFIVKNLKKVITAVDDISEGEGDLTKLIRINSKDEAGSLSQSFNRFILSQRGMIIDLKGVSSNSRENGHSLASNAEEISSAVVEIHATMNSISNKTGTLSSEIEHSESSIESITDMIAQLEGNIALEGEYISNSSIAIEQMVASIKSISKITKEKKDSIDDLIRIAVSGEDDMDNTVHAIEEISQSADTMLDMIQVINNVSDQINLLSMNAAIEAAHAGDAGKGFAVVADEIRNLAVTTTESTNMMSKSLTAIIQRITDASTLSGSTGKTIKKIMKEIVEVSGSFSEVIVSIEEIAGGTNQITSSLSDLVNTSSDVKKSSEEMSHATAEIKNSFSHVTTLASQNKDGMAEINRGIEEISSALTELSVLGSRNSENLAKLNDIVRKFKTEE